MSYARGIIDILTFRDANKDSRTLGKSAYAIENVLCGCFVAVSRGKFFQLEFERVWIVNQKKI